MTADPRAALALLVSALERHLEVATTRRDPDDLGVIAAAEALAEAFDDYDEILFAATEVATPLAVYGDEDDFDDDDDEDEVDPRTVLDGEATVYAGLDDEDVDFDDSEDDDEDDDSEDDHSEDDDDEDDDSEDDEDERG